ncbi:unnamed protein product, partial [Cochlearia groenlandica]
VIGHIRFTDGDDLQQPPPVIPSSEFPGDPHMVVNSSSSAITKLETVTIAELTHFLQAETPRVGLNGWNYISCTGCKSNMEESGTSLVCTNNKCIKPLNVGLIRYRFEVSVSDTTGTTTFVIFDDAVKKLIAKTAGDLMVELTGDGGQVAPTERPQCLLDLVGRKCKFQIKVTDYNFKAIRQTFTVSRILEDNIVVAPPSAPPLEAYVNIADSNVHVRNDDVQVAAPPERPVPDINNNIPGVGENPMYTRNGTSSPFVASTTQPVGIASSSTSKEHAENKQKLA